MNLLIVDDEFYYAEGLKNIIQNSDIHFNRIDCAYNMTQAKEFFQKERIEVMVCDIEMPQGSGLELVEWVLKEGYDTETIFLTAYANFNYALGALKLQSADYLLKPVGKEELMPCITNAINSYKKKQKRNSLEEQSQHLQKHQEREQFWNALCHDVIPLSMEHISKNLRRYNMPNTMSGDYYYVGLLRTFLSKEDERLETNLYDYAIKNVVIETLEPFNAFEAMIRLNEQDFFLCLQADATGDFSLFTHLCHQLIGNLKEWLPGNFQLYINEAIQLTDVSPILTSLKEQAYQNIHHNRDVISTLQPSSGTDTFISIPLEQWTELLTQKKYDEATASALDYLCELQINHAASRRDLIRFKHDYLQIIYSILDKKGESAHILFSDKETTAIYEQACDSVGKIKEWLNHAMETFRQVVDATDESESTVKLVKQYIKANLSKELSRGELATLAYISPDYLSHIFKEETGESLSSYILTSRMTYAKELLITTQQSVSEIALASGFPNVSYFSRQFKRLNGCTPMEYRKSTN